MQHPETPESQNEVGFSLNSPKWLPSLPVISGSALVDALNQSKPVIAHFFGLWNEYDGIVHKHLSSLEPQFCEVLSFIACDISDQSNFTVCSELRILTVPTVLGVRRAKIVSRMDGRMPAQSYERLCQALSRQDWQGGSDDS